MVPNTIKLSDLVYHIKTKHVQQEKIKCTHCDKKYATEKLMKVRVREVHMKLKPFKCSYCEEKFGSSITLYCCCKNMYKILKYIDQMINIVLVGTRILNSRYTISTYYDIPSYGLGTSIKILDKVIEKIIIIFTSTKNHIRPHNISTMLFKN